MNILINIVITDFEKLSHFPKIIVIVYTHMFRIAQSFDSSE